MKRAWLGLRWPLVSAAALFATHLLLGHFLAAREPLAAVLAGRYWVALLAVTLLGVRLALLFAGVPWILYALTLFVIERRRARDVPAPPNDEQRRSGKTA